LVFGIHQVELGWEIWMNHGLSNARVSVDTIRVFGGVVQQDLDLSFVVGIYDARLNEDTVGSQRRRIVDLDVRKRWQEDAKASANEVALTGKYGVVLE
jgi:hypothetical protein